jgi:formylglycine-generating enzyme
MPAVCITWQQAQEYCRYKGKRLPTEAEWEYSALAGTQNPYAWGTEKPSGQCASAWDKGPRPVCNSSPNKWQLCDMTGNVWEWVQDRYQNDYYGESPSSNPQGPEVGRYRVIRGGGWYSTPLQLRIKNRHWFSPEFCEISIGFRCAR